MDKQVYLYRVEVSYTATAIANVYASDEDAARTFAEEQFRCQPIIGEVDSFDIGDILSVEEAHQ